MRVAEAMTRSVQLASPDQSIADAAKLMADCDCGVLPVQENDRLVGMITDRDITVRATSAGEAPDGVTVEEVMTDDVRWCYADQEVDEVMQQMADVQIRRVPVLDRESESLIGIVALGDLATKHSAQVDRTLEGISTPARPDR